MAAIYPWRAIPYSPASGEGYAMTQVDWFGNDPNFAHPFKNFSWPEMTMSAIVHSTREPGTITNRSIFNLKGIGTIHMYIRKRPITQQLFFGMSLNTEIAGNNQLIAQGAVELSIDHPRWLISHWYWLGVSYDSVAGICVFAMTNLTLREDTVTYPVVQNQEAVNWGGDPHGETVCAWGFEGGTDPEPSRFRGTFVQVLIHDKYVALGDFWERRKFNCLDGSKSLGLRGQRPFGEIPKVYLPRGLPTDNLGTMHIGDPSDFFLLNELPFDTDLPPVGSCGSVPPGLGMMQFNGLDGYYGKTSITTTGNKVTAVARFNVASFSGAGAGKVIKMGGAGTIKRRMTLIIYSNDRPTVGERNKLQFWVENSAGVTICSLWSTVDLADGADHVVFAAFDGDTGTAIFRVDGVDADDTGNAGRVAPTIGTLAAGTTSELSIGGSGAVAAFNLVTGEIGYVGYRDTYLTNWSDFMDGNTPKQLDESGWTEWGAQPSFWHEAGLMTEHLGSGGQMILHGSVPGPIV